MADNERSTTIDVVLDRDVFNSLQLATFFKMLLGESPAGESRAFEKLNRLIDAGLPIWTIPKGGRGPDGASYPVSIEALKAALKEAMARWQADFEEPDESGAESPDVLDEIWRIRVGGIPERHYVKLGSLWVCKEDYRYACARLGATHYHWPKNSQLVDEDGLGLRSGSAPTNDNYIPLTPLLEEWFNQPLAHLPDELRLCVTRAVFAPWDDLSEAQRRDAVTQWDYQHDPNRAEERERVWALECKRQGMLREIKNWESRSPQNMAEMAIQEDRLKALREQLEAVESQWSTPPHKGSTGAANASRTTIAERRLEDLRRFTDNIYTAARKGDVLSLEGNGKRKPLPFSFDVLHSVFIARHPEYKIALRTFSNDVGKISVKLLPGPKRCTAQVLVDLLARKI